MTSLLAQTPAAQVPSWIDGSFIFGILLTAFLVICLLGALRLSLGAHNQKTGSIAGKLLNYGIIAVFIVLLIGGGLWVMASGSIDGLTEGINTDVTGPN